MRDDFFIVIIDRVHNDTATGVGMIAVVIHVDLRPSYRDNQFETPCLLIATRYSMYKCITYPFPWSYVVYLQGRGARDWFVTQCERIIF